ncbi:serine/threonine-protein kinase RsbW [Amycolatopsis lurida]|uniref:Anti-sigma factor n=1 Tax=Amycolatopsis lurida NRRL 2430 TaxID=1460371 RepID=A0A2P2FK38_AMYLU|nr:anti-sigma factor [Amycolatopsis lurida]KFU77087.1 anti-sigma factor [Amycolatopsis lurida NRRL 2430]SEC52423.1 serine/threonine-protein kinase RsbW [Amycolatopsis lurida]
MDAHGRGGLTPQTRSQSDGLSDRVELRLPAEAEQIPLVRTLTHGVVSRADFGLDAISDAKMAVDEACSQLVQPAELGAVLCCVFHEIPEGIAVSISTRTNRPYLPSETTFGWHVLTTLTHSVRARCEPIPGETGGTTTIDLVLAPGTSDG